LVSLQRSGQPGEDNSTFLIRGNSTTGSNTPLVLVDGISEPNWQRINPNDVEQVSVLKDAAAAIYGVQAGNGVILITTKRGKTGKPTFDVTYNQGVYQLTRFPKMASSATLAEYGNEYLVRTGFEEKWTQEEIEKFRDGTDPRYPNTDWVDAVIKDFSTQESANLNIRGGSDNMRYSLSGSFQHKGDILKGGIHDFKGYTVRSNIDSDVSKYITLSLDMNVGFDRQVEPAYSSWYYNRAMNPQYPVYYPGGYYSDPPSDYGNHPLLVNSGGGGDQ
jgi:TonB-dependent SusC/RagA subfamily outer membrane receptor